MVLPQGAGWRALVSRGLASLSPPEAEHTLLELPTNRAEYVSVLQDWADYPLRSPIGQRVPTVDEVAALASVDGRWRAIVLLDDERALRTAAGLFNRVFVLDPFYDSGALLYAAWHDPSIRDEHARRLAEHAAMLVRAAPLLSSGAAVLAPDHLPGSWTPRPDWKKPPRGADRRQMAAWAMRCSLVLLYWADRLDAVVCTTRGDVMAALDVGLGPRARSISLEVTEPARIEVAQASRAAAVQQLHQQWAAARRLSRRRTRRGLEDVADVISDVADVLDHAGESGAWRLSLGERSLPDPALLIRRVMNGQDPQRDPPLARRPIRRAPLCLLPAYPRV